MVKISLIIASVVSVSAATATVQTHLDSAHSLKYEMSATETSKLPSEPRKEHEDKDIRRTIHEGYIEGDYYRCDIIGHGQSDGRCVHMHSPALRTATELPSAYFACPEDYPYPLEGFLSGNPVWDSTSNGAIVSVKAVLFNGDKEKNYSYAGSKSDPGWLFVTGFGKNYSTIEGNYACSDTPANPR